MASALIVSPRIELRKNLEAHLHQLSRFTAVTGFPAFADAKDIVLKEGVPEFVFLSDDIQHDERETFIEWMRKRKLGTKAVVVTLSKAKLETEELAERLVEGAHAILTEPITLSSLEAVLSVARGVKLNGTESRLKTAACLFLSSELDKLTAAQGIEADKRDITTKVRDAARDFKELTGVSLTLDAIRPHSLKRGDESSLEEYRGVSRRVREIYELRLRQLIGKIFEKKTPRA